MFSSIKDKIINYIITRQSAGIYKFLIGFLASAPVANFLTAHGITVSIDPVKFQGLVALAIAWVIEEAHRVYDWVKAKRSKKV